MSISPSPTLKHIADRLKISKTAVSMALRNHPRISRSLCARVRRTAEAMGYAPNAFVSAHMASVRTNRPPRHAATIGVVLCWTQKQFAGIKELFELYRRGLKQRAAQLGYQLDQFWISDEAYAPAQLEKVLLNRGIHGLILPPIPVAGSAWPEFAWEHFAAVALGYSIRSPDLHRSCPDAFGSAGVVLTQLAARGYRRPGLVLARNDDARVNHLVLARYHVWQQIESDDEAVPVLLADTLDADSVLRWYRKHRPDAIISPSPQVASWLKSGGVRVPRDAGFATTYRLPSNIGISGVDQNYVAVGSAAVDMLVGQLHRNERGLPTEPKLMLMPSRWVEGDTLRPADAHSAPVRAGVAS